MECVGRLEPPKASISSPFLSLHPSPTLLTDSDTWGNAQSLDHVQEYAETNLHVENLGSFSYTASTRQPSAGLLVHSCLDDSEDSFSFHYFVTDNNFGHVDRAHPEDIVPDNLPTILLALEILPESFSAARNPLTAPLWRRHERVEDGYPCTYIRCDRVFNAHRDRR